MATEETKSAATVLNVLTVVVLLVALVAGITIATEHPALPPAPLSAQDLVFSPDGAIAYVAENGQIGVEQLGVKGASTTQVIPLPGGSVTHLAITPNGDRLVAASTATSSTGRPRGELSIVNLTTAPPKVRSLSTPTP